jgi:hypothetical protein
MDLAEVLGPEVPAARIAALADLISAIVERAAIARSSRADVRLLSQTVQDQLSRLLERAPR